MDILIEFYHKNILDNMISVLSLKPDVLMIYFDPERYSHTDVYDIYLACQKYIPHLRLETGTYPSADFKKIDEKLNAYVSGQPKDSLTIDLTGGNELTAVASYRCALLGSIRLVYSSVQHSRVCNLFEPEKKYGCHYFELADIIEADGGRIVSASDSETLNKEKRHLMNLTRVILENVPLWSSTCSYFQKNSISNRVNHQLHFEGKIELWPKNHRRVPDERMLQAFSKEQFIRHLYIKGDRVSFDYKNREAMGYISSFGVWLELRTYFAMAQSQQFHDVLTGVKIDWNRNDGNDIVGNEIDVMALYGCVPVVISCKMSEHATDADAVNELYTVSRRVSKGHVIRVLVTYSDIKAQRSGIYLKALEMGIIVMDKDDIMHPAFSKRLERAICQSIQK
ncbi:MAG: Card1-like endonuclease domain-containing protein [Catenibacillus sp.]